MFYKTGLTLGIFPLKICMPIQIHNLETLFNPQELKKKSKTNNSINVLSFFFLLKVRFCQIAQTSLKLAMLLNAGISNTLLSQATLIPF